MDRYVVYRLFCLTWIVTTIGCASMVETRTIEKFAEALTQQNLDKLKAGTSTEFQHKALRLDQSISDIQLLNIPDGENEVLEVEEVSDSERVVKVEVGKRKVHYRLTWDEDGRQWVVDDIFMKQKRDGITAVKSVTEQMDLLTSVREFLVAWESGQPDAIFSVSSADFNLVLKDVPPQYLTKLAAKAVGNDESARMSEKAFKPKVQMDEDVAIITLRRPVGKMVLSYRLEDNQWKVRDIAVESSDGDEHIPSLKKMAEVITKSVMFVDAFRQGDHTRLSESATTQFYRNGIYPGDLKTVSLPDPLLAHETFKVSVHGQRAFFEIPTEREVVRIQLVAANPISETVNDVDIKTDFRVQEVTIYELAGKQEKTLSALLTAQALVQLFGEALVTKQLPRIQKSASPEFNAQVWKQLDDESFRRLTLFDLAAHIPRVRETQFHGKVTYVDATVGQADVRYVLQTRNGKLLVDDIIVPINGSMQSIKTIYEHLIPIQQYATALETGQLGRVQRGSTRDFNGLIWSQVDQIPHLAVNAARNLRAPMTSLQIVNDDVFVILGDDRWGARVHLNREYQNSVVNDILVVDGPDTSQRFPLKDTLRRLLARGEIRPNQPTISANVPVISSEPIQRFSGLPTSNGVPHNVNRTALPFDQPLK